MKKWVFYGALLGLVFSCTEKQDQVSSNRNQQFPLGIYMGQETGDQQWYATVALTSVQTQSGRKGVFCTGSLVAPNIVLTAAHCLVSEDMSKVSVYLGSGSYEPYVGERKIKEVYVSPDFANDFGVISYDFGFVILDDPIDGSDDFIIPVVKDRGEVQQALTVGGDVTLVGYGQVEDGRGGKKREVTTKITNVLRYEFNAGEGGRDTCFGDSGGPAFAKLSNGEYRIIGVTSGAAYGVRALCGEKTRYSRADLAMEWVYRVLGYRDLKEGRIESALSFFEKSLELTEEPEKVITGLGIAKWIQGNIDLSLSYFKSLEGRHVSPLADIYQNGFPELSFALIRDHGFDVNGIDRERKSLIHLVIEEKNIEKLKFLIDSFPEIDLNLKNSDWFTPLARAKKLKWDEGADLLKEHGALDSVLLF